MADERDNPIVVPLHEILNELSQAKSKLAKCGRRFDTMDRRFDKKSLVIIIARVCRDGEPDCPASRRNLQRCHDLADPHRRQGWPASSAAWRGSRRKSTVDGQFRGHRRVALGGTE
jgi:hypothetical protein